MKYLDRQESARQRTRVLQAQFVLLAILALALAFLLALVLGYGFTLTESVVLRMLGFLRRMPVASELLVGAMVHAAILVPIVLSRRKADLDQVLQELRAKLEERSLVDPKDDPNFRRLSNVVEEVALASGVPAPRIRLWPNYRAINSVTLGYGPADAEIYVTRMAVDGLSRSELQALVAFSMSQIINGDMALNMRLASFAHWFLVCPRFAIWMMRAPNLSYRPGDPAHTRRAPVTRFLFWLLVSAPLGVALFSVTWPLTFAADFLQSRVSRERQRLGDASVIQLTREQLPLEDLLFKALACAANTRKPIGVPELLGTFAHCCFIAPNVMHFLSPQHSLLERLHALNPSLGLTEPETRELAKAEAKVRERGDTAERLRESLLPRTGRTTDLLIEAPLVVAAATPVPRRAPSVAPLPSTRLDETTAGLFALLLDRNPQIRARQLAFLQRQLDDASWERVTVALESLGSLLPADRSRAVDQRLPSLRELPAAELRTVQEYLATVEAFDDSVDVFEFALMRSVRVFIEDFIRPRAPHGDLTLGGVQDEIIMLFATLASLSSRQDAAAAFDAGLRELGMHARPPYRRVSTWAKPMEGALARLDELTPLAKNLLLDALAVTAGYDGSRNPGERELLRAIATCLHCPQPRESVG